MEDKTFELLTEMYSEFKKRFDAVDKKFDNVDCCVKSTGECVYEKNA